ncbi:SH3 domain-containing protein C23A1.17 [Trichoderma asperellum]|nr:SH3 domain-containing protein C23A1.17 [Trichoderma asperellum]
MSRPSLSAPRRSIDHHRPSMDSGFIAGDIDLAVQSGWWKQSNQVPPVLQGRKDIYFECDESTTTNQGEQTMITRETFILFQDYSQTILTVRYDPYDPSTVELEQRHEGPPKTMRQDQMEEAYDTFGRKISAAAIAKKDQVVGDGSAASFVLEMIRPLEDALWPISTRSYGALVYSNMANASTQQHDAIRPGDIITIRNAKFQGKHGPMHAKYSAEVGKPDHVGVVAEWDGTKKKVRAWEQGRDGKKVRQESYKLDDLRSGEVKIWRVVSRSWVGWQKKALA